MKFSFYRKVILCISLYFTMIFVTITTQETEMTEEGTIRLTNGNDTFGRVEIFLDNQWGTICDDGWELIDAIVVCRQLGFKTANLATSGLFPEGSPGVIHFENLNCHGNEESILDCRFNINHDCSDFEAVDVSCTDYEHGDVRLVDGNATTGLIQIFLNGQKGGICSDGWNLESANVSCRQLGFNDVIFLLVEERYLDDRTESFYLNNVNCIGNESTLIDCYFTKNENCSNESYAGVVCQDTVLFQDGALRLEDGNETAGRIEVYLDGNWGTICDDGWDYTDALVVCRQLGFKDAERSFIGLGEFFGLGAGFIHFDDLQCFGYERSVLDCNYTVTHDCTVHEDVGVSCVTYGEGDLRLDGKNYTSGFVEIFIDNKWGYVCGDEWDIEEAEVVCRQLDFNGVASIHEYTLQLGDVVHFRGFMCTGSESSILDCTPIPGNDCKENKISAVTCNPFEEGQIRLVDGPDKYAGRVELFSRGTWGTICDDDWDLTDGSVVCRQLGYGGALLHTVAAFPFGPGDGAIHLRIVNCHGNETDLTSCPSNDIFCDHNEDAGVICETSSFNTEFPVRLVDGLAGPFSGRVEVFIGGQWGTICGEEWDIEDANVVCTQLGYGWALDAGQENRRSALSRPIALSRLGCDGNETSLSQCDYPSVGVPQYDCYSDEDAAVFCSAACLNGRCPADIETTLESPSQLTTQVFWAEPSEVTILCQNVNVSYSHSPGERFEEGVTVVSYFVENAAGKRAECNFTVSVFRKTCPEITCPPDIMTSLEYSSDTTAVFWTKPSPADDSCSAASLTSSHSPGDQFKEGATVVSYASGNKNVCNFTVEVIKEARPIPLAAPIIPSVTILLLLIFVCVLWKFKVPKRFRGRPLPRIPSKHQASFVNPAYQPSPSGDKNGDAGSVYDFILEEGDLETAVVIADTYGITNGLSNLGDKGEVVKNQISQIGQNDKVTKQENTASNGKTVKTSFTHETNHDSINVDSNHLNKNEYSIDPGENVKRGNQEKQSTEGNIENVESEDHYIVMKNLKSDVTVDNHRGEGHERAVIDQSCDRENGGDVLVLNLGEF